MTSFFSCIVAAVLFVGATHQSSAQAPVPTPPVKDDTKQEVKDQVYEVFEFSEAEMPKYDENELVRHIVYPPEARSAGIEGTVILKFIVEGSGQASNIESVTPANQLFIDAATLALKQIRFTPATQFGKPVRVWMSMPFRFTLK